MKKLPLILTLLTLLLGGCGTNLHAEKCNLAIEPANLTDEELAAAVASVDEWEQALGGLVDFEVSIGSPGTGDHVIRPLTHQAFLDRATTTGDVGFTEMRERCFLGWCGAADEIFLDVDRLREVNEHPSPTFALRFVLLHEIGHHLALEHEEGPVVMTAKGPMIMMDGGWGVIPACVAEGDLDQVREVYGDRADGFDMRSSCDEDDVAEAALWEGGS